MPCCVQCHGHVKRPTTKVRLEGNREMKIGVPSETAQAERRVALVPEVVRKLTASGHAVVVEAGAGEAAGIPDALFGEAGASFGDPWDTDVVAKVAAPEDTSRLSGESVLIGFLAPLANSGGIQAIAATGATAFAMEAIPRISRAQSMDALSSQATVAGYRAALIGAQELGRFYPMLMTAAGTIPPAQVLVLGAGVAGLQAIATARRLGAVVTAFDVRSAVAEQVRSLGARFLELEGVADAEAAGGYARELTDEEQALQRAAVDEQIARSDVVICTALVPGRPAPRLVSAAAVGRMRPGAVIVDLAAEAGGNCELSRAGETITTENAVRIAAPLNLPSSMAEHASQLYARNVQSLLELMSGADGALELDFADEIIRGACITCGGEIVHAGARQAAGVS
jgi:H+-translocating NAD(P) transhydrogenase subunit alpha